MIIFTIFLGVYLGKSVKTASVTYDGLIATCAPFRRMIEQSEEMPSRSPADEPAIDERR